MNQRQEIAQAWDHYSATAFHSSQFARARQFFHLIEERPEMCWDDLVEEFRKNYYDAFDVIIPVLLSTDDPLIVHNIVQFADLSNPKEADTIKGVIRSSDPQKHQVTLQELAGVKSLRPELMKKPKLPENVRHALGLKKKADTGT